MSDGPGSATRGEVKALSVSKRDPAASLRGGRRGQNTMEVAESSFSCPPWRQGSGQGITGEGSASAFYLRGCAVVNLHDGGKLGASL